MKQEIIDELKNMGSCLGDMQAGMPYAVPDGYFAAFAAGVNDLAAVDDKIVLERSLPYNIPDGYFNSLPKQITESVTKEKRKGIVITFKQLRWAAAAVFFITVGLGAYNLSTRTNEATKDGLLASVGDKEIREYLATSYQPASDKVMNSGYLDKLELDTKEIIKYLDETGWGADSY